VASHSFCPQSPASPPPLTPLQPGYRAGDSTVVLGPPGVWLFWACGGEPPCSLPGRDLTGRHLSWPILIGYHTLPGGHCLRPQPLPPPSTAPPPACMAIIYLPTALIITFYCPLCPPCHHPGRQTTPSHYLWDSRRAPTPALRTCPTSPPLPHLPCPPHLPAWERCGRLRDADVARRRQSQRACSGIVTTRARRHATTTPPSAYAAGRQAATTARARVGPRTGSAAWRGIVRRR